MDTDTFSKLHGISQTLDSMDWSSLPSPIRAKLCAAQQAVNTALRATINHLDDVNHKRFLSSL